MYQLKIKNAESPDDYRTFELDESQWHRVRQAFVQAGVCQPEAFDRINRRVVVTYYPGTLPLGNVGDDTLDLL